MIQPDSYTRSLLKRSPGETVTARGWVKTRRDSKNVPLQYVLADRYRETGQVDMPLVSPGHWKDIHTLPVETPSGEPSK